MKSSNQKWEIFCGFVACLWVLLILLVGTILYQPLWLLIFLQFTALGSPIILWFVPLLTIVFLYGWKDSQRIMRGTQNIRYVILQCLLIGLLGAIFSRLIFGSTPQNRTTIWVLWENRNELIALTVIGMVAAISIHYLNRLLVVRKNNRTSI